MTLLLTGLVNIFNLKDQATSKKSGKVLNKLGLKTKTKMRESKFSTKGSIVSLRPFRGTHWIA